jgi:predicted enzyme related to lactoylglutathione lyase
MKAETITVGVPVRDLHLAIAWYQAAFELGEPDQIPLDGLAEFDLGAFWLQLALAPELAGREGISLNISVQDASAEHQGFIDRGLTVTELQRFEGVVEFFELTDLDGNKIGFVTELI